ncbi:unnamed protein product [Allacma fusca]|uniref:Uncharacterized protein n=1 Tax=Allacma fusca TaxID=39272 RepID=A0A8J2L2W0_9HEXA|nr:unnamed protein product [Allacma fusca]
MPRINMIRRNPISNKKTTVTPDKTPKLGKLLAEKTIKLDNTTIILGIQPLTFQPVMAFLNNNKTMEIDLIEIKDLLSYMPTYESADLLNRAHMITLDRKKIWINGNVIKLHTKKTSIQITIKDLKTLKLCATYVENVWNQLKSLKSTYLYEYAQLGARLREYKNDKFIETIPEIQAMLQTFMDNQWLPEKQGEIIAKAGEKIVEEFYFQ